jgi:hypothetical protein
VAAIPETVGKTVDNTRSDGGCVSTEVKYIYPKEMRRLIDIVVACYVTMATGINGYLAVKFWRGLFK